MTDERLPIERMVEFSTALLSAWSLQSSTLWTTENPAAGHCGVTALVANDLFGGDIYKTRYGDVWHFYNVIDGHRHDFTKSQFAKPLSYSGVESDCEEAFGDTNAEQCAHLKEMVCRLLGAKFISHH